MAEGQSFPLAALDRPHSVNADQAPVAPFRGGEVGGGAVFFEQIGVGKLPQRHVGIDHFKVAGHGVTGSEGQHRLLQIGDLVVGSGVAQGKPADRRNPKS